MAVNDNDTPAETWPALTRIDSALYIGGAFASNIAVFDADGAFGVELERRWNAFEKMEEELAFLRYFHAAAGDAFGPAESDVYHYINEDYDGVVPHGYSEGDEEEESF